MRWIVGVLFLSLSAFGVPSPAGKLPIDKKLFQGPLALGLAGPAPAAGAATPFDKLTAEEREKFTDLLQEYMFFTSTYEATRTRLKELTEELEVEKQKPADAKNAVLLRRVSMPVRNTASRIADLLAPVLKKMGMKNAEEPAVSYHLTSNSIEINYFKSSKSLEAKDEPIGIVEIKMTVDTDKRLEVEVNLSINEDAK